MGEECYVAVFVGDSKGVSVAANVGYGYYRAILGGDYGRSHGYGNVYAVVEFARSQNGIGSEAGGRGYRPDEGRNP